MKQQTFALAAAWRGDWRGSREDEETLAWERLAWSPGEPGRKLGFGGVETEGEAGVSACPAG